MAAFCVIETVVLGSKGNDVVLGTCAVIAIWTFTIAAWGKGRPERSSNAVRNAGIVAAVLSGVALLAAYVLWDLTIGGPSLRLGRALGVGTVAMTMMVFFIAREHAIKQQELAEARERLAAERAEREASARALAEAQLNVLQAQIEPHFVFNALSNLQSLIGEDPAAAQRMTAALTHYLRQAMPQRRGAATTLGRQLELTRAYLDIMRMRMGERLRYRIRADEDALAVPFPPLIMATLVENAIKHGLEPKPGGGFIDIAARCQDRRLVVEVCDDGVGFPPDAQGGHGVGLANTRARLAALYGDRASLEIAANLPSGVVVTVTIPLEPADAHGADR
jgi:sensor histidine kinase YesM